MLLTVTLLTISACAPPGKIEWFPCKLKETAINTGKTTSPNATTWDVGEQIRKTPDSKRCYIDIDVNDSIGISGIRAPVLNYRF